MSSHHSDGDAGLQPLQECDVVAGTLSKGGSDNVCGGSNQGGIACEAAGAAMGGLEGKGGRSGGRLSWGRLRRLSLYHDAHLRAMHKHSVSEAHFAATVFLPPASAAMSVCRRRHRLLTSEAGSKVQGPR